MRAGKALGNRRIAADGSRRPRPLLDGRFRGHDSTGSRQIAEALRSQEEPMANPSVVEATRGERIESAHRGAGAVVDAGGRVVMAFGDAERPIYPRSAVKALQALPLVASGAADRLALNDKE